ncbi:nucleotidyltransferase family protein [Winogradskyella sediminis]|uniref:Uncharacterized nucleotidyltransferase n=1 Tax=Winogradskyella sediminis TaxID=1382466 RepID=A0A1H1PWI6_9FLAO|nr:nucleotidyltransferase family protein [Winogradskyella sediminis]SDS15466.1 Uncharacterised nucleotidyltransferase [Winogradskyella sediminis]
MDHLVTTYQHIAHILSFETKNFKLEQTLGKTTYNWDNIVIEGSKQLILPAIYCRLKAKQLLHLLPQELANYLEEITSINRTRNLRILNQVHTISQILRQHHIDHVFLKGSALLISGCYEDNGERMVGDIDVLVEKSKVHEAFDILKHSGYNKTHGFAYQKKNFRHLDRLISEKELAAIELHTELLNKKHWSLLDMASILNSKQIKNKIPIPSNRDLSLHLILSWQLNDKGHYYNILGLKSIYDLISIKIYKDEAYINELLSSKYAQAYLELAKRYFPEFTKVTSNNYMKRRQLAYQVKMSSTPLRLIINFSKSVAFFISNRLYLIFTNKSYTTHIIKTKILSKITLFKNT